MSDQAAAAPEQPSTPPADDTDASEDRRIPFDRFDRVNKERSAFKKERDELARQLEERENAGLPELERERKAREAAEKRLQEADARIAEAERKAVMRDKTDWVRDAAQAAGFHSPSAAARLIDLDGVDSAEEAERQVKRLAKKEGWMVKPSEPERPEIGRVLTNGQRETTDGKSQPTGAQADLNDPAFKRQLGQEMLDVLRGGGNG